MRISKIYKKQFTVVIYLRVEQIRQIVKWKKAFQTKQYNEFYLDLNKFLLSLIPWSGEHLKVWFQCFQIPLTTGMFPVWDFMVGIFAQKATL